MTFRSGPVRSWIRELAWLLGSWAFSWALLSQLVGYNYLWHSELGIQLYNTYFVVQPLLLTMLVFLPVATLVTGVRVLAGAFRHFGPNAVLGLLMAGGRAWGWADEQPALYSTRSDLRERCRDATLRVSAFALFNHRSTRRREGSRLYIVRPFFCISLRNEDK